MTVIVLEILSQDRPQVTFTYDQHPVGAFAADGAHPTLGIILPRPAWGATGSAPAANSVNFATQAAINAGLAGRFEVSKPFAAIGDTRKVFKADMRENNDCPAIEVNARTLEVTINNRLVDRTEYATILPMAQRYFLF
ncbi:hypothetical protein ACFLIM_45680 [Nonomuraea sp. M3C6]|uniref:Urease domain-containing protein n=1 Tax=Nonomuraea marmarensis TaxID=3351344 RepID=A0ABW7AW84_9ACTN